MRAEVHELDAHAWLDLLHVGAPEDIPWARGRLWLAIQRTMPRPFAVDVEAGEVKLEDDGGTHQGRMCWVAMKTPPVEMSAVTPV